jgi:ribulose-phosphate 3-epimerase
MSKALYNEILAQKPLLSIGTLTADWMNLRSELAILENAGIRLLHIDVMDGCAWPKITVGPTFVQGLKTPLFKDVHVLTCKPERHVEDFVKAGADIITFSAENCSDISSTLANIAAMRNRNDPCRGILKGLSLDPKSPLDLILPHLKEIDILILLAVGPDTGTSNFLSALPAKINKLRSLRQDLIICIDGAVSRKTITDVVAMRPEIIITGSAVFDGKNPGENLKFMLDAVKQR